MTPAQRTKKLEQARSHAKTARRYLVAAVDDMAAESFGLTSEQRAEWALAVRALTQLDQVIAVLPDK